MTAIPTLPGTVNPLRGLVPFAESERDVFFGRDRERDELAALITAEGFRAGLLYGESGVGKTSLLRAGLVPHLRDHGVITVVCEDLSRPIEALAYSLGQATGVAPNDGEPAVAFLARVVSQALAGQLYVFIIDHIESVLGDERVAAELGDLYARVVTRSGGRARFLFCCDSEKVHLFGSLERRTGSLFPPSSRYELHRFATAEAAAVLERTLSLAGVGADPQLAHGIASALGASGPVLAADLQIAALALRELGLASPDELARLGGPAELERTWILSCARATGNERSALRAAAELAAEPIAPAVPEWVATRASIDAGFSFHALSVLADKGVVHRIGAPDQPHFILAHSILAPRVREVAAPARDSARRAYELLGSKAEGGKRLSAREYLALRREKITPATSEERRVVDRTRRFYLTIAAAAAAAPVVLLVAIYISMSGRYYLDVAPGIDGGPERVVVRAGRAGLSAFHWMPASPGFGSIVADTGFTRQMVSAQAWEQIADRDLGGERSGDGYVTEAIAALDPTLAALTEYAASGSERALEQLRKEADTPEEMVALLEALRPIARGGPQETGFIETALDDTSPAVRAAALGVASEAARRRAGAYQEVLAAALKAGDAQQRRLAFSAVRSLPDEQARALFQSALADSPEADARRELLAEVTAGQGADRPSAQSATSVLANKDISPAVREKARTLLRRAFSVTPAEAALAAAELAADAKAAPEDRVLAIELLHEFAPEESYEQIRGPIKDALDAQPEAVKAAALPLYARIAPDKAGGELAVLQNRKDELDESLLVALALGWGEVARVTKDDDAAHASLDQLLEDRRSGVRAAAARAYGYLGKGVQSDLVKMVKKERYDVAIGAAHGLVNSVDVGGSRWTTVSGVRELWKKKGARKREAARLYARLARTEAAAAYTYLRSAANDKDDQALHAIGVEGLCNGLAAGHKSSRYALQRAASDDLLEVRRLVIQCVVDNPDQEATAIKVALDLSSDSDQGIRAEAAKVLARATSDDKVAGGVAKGLAELAADEDTSVRIIAIRALGQLGDKAPKGAGAALTRAFDRADEAEKLAILETARAIGAGDLAAVAMSDESPLVRIAGIDTAIELGAGVAAAVGAALTDKDPAVRRAALERLATQGDKLPAEETFKGLSLATRDADPTIRRVALTTLARVGDAERVLERLRSELGSRSEEERARAAAAAVGMVERDPKAVLELLVPLLQDPSHDVRRALLPSLAAAYAALNSDAQLAEMLRATERNSMKRLVTVAAFLTLARTDSGREAALARLGELAEKSRPLVRLHARMAQGLLGSEADGIAFLALLVP